MRGARPTLATRAFHLLALLLVGGVASLVAGCPAVRWRSPQEDLDGDRIPDIRDACPDKAETVNGRDDADGCPEIETPEPMDRDGDGIPDSLDACPDQPENLDGRFDDDGCPEPAAGPVSFDRDQDHDGVPDPLDTCVAEPETPNGRDDLDGCPDDLIPGAATLTWPPPAASSRCILHPAPSEGSTLGRLAATLSAALQAAGYPAPGWYQLSDGSGFALVTPPEQIDEAGRPRSTDRWTHAWQRPEILDLSTFLHALVFPALSRWRVLLLAVTHKPSAPPTPAPEVSTFPTLAAQGGLALPPALQARSWSTAYTTVALVYEFTQAAPDVPPTLLAESPTPACQQLAASALPF